MFPFPSPLLMCGAGTIEPSLSEFVTNTGATQPQLSTATYPASLHDAANDMTWLSWEGWNGTARTPCVAGFDHSTGYWTDIAAVGVTPLVDDDHGPPAICLDDEGHLHVFHGNHNTAQLHSSTVSPIAGASMSGLWRVNDQIAGAYTYPHPVAVGSDIYLFVRKFVGSGTYNLYLRKTATLAAGVATWASEAALVSFGASTRFYMGTALKSGTDIWIVATKGAEPDTAREHVYLFVYDTLTGAVKNHDGSFSVASGSLPVTLSDADTNYRLFTHSGGNNEGGAPALCFDTNGDPHILFKDGSGNPTGTYTVKHIMRSGGSWTSPATVTTVDNRFNCPVLAPLAGGWVEAWYPLDPTASFTRYGNMVRRLRSPAGVWQAEHTILEAATDGLGNPTIVLDAHADARVVFSENVESELDADAGSLRTFVYGDGGLIAYEAAPEPVNSGTADGKELREDGDDALREDGSFELRETA